MARCTVSLPSLSFSGSPSLEFVPRLVLRVRNSCTRRRLGTGTRGRQLKTEAREHRCCSRCYTALICRKHDDTCDIRTQVSRRGIPKARHASNTSAEICACSILPRMVDYRRKDAFRVRAEARLYMGEKVDSVGFWSGWFGMREISLTERILRLTGKTQWTSYGSGHTTRTEDEYRAEGDGHMSSQG